MADGLTAVSAPSPPSLLPSLKPGASALECCYVYLFTGEVGRFVDCQASLAII